MKVQGTVVGTRALGDRQIVTVTAPADIDVITENATSLGKGTCVVIQGKKGSYNGAPQITASKITLCK